MRHPKKSKSLMLRHCLLLSLFFQAIQKPQQVSAQASGEVPDIISDGQANLTFTESVTSEIATSVKDHSFGNLNLQEGSNNNIAPSEDSGLYLLSQHVPVDGKISRVKTCGFLLARDRNKLVHEITGLSMFTFISVYKQVGESYVRLYSPYLLNYNVNKTEQFGCGVCDLTSLGWIVSRGDRLGILIPNIGCFQLSKSPSQVITTCPAHINLIDPVKNCSQAYYFRGSASMLTGGEIPEMLSLQDGHPEDVFMNLEITIESESDVVQNADVVNPVCAIKVSPNGAKEANVALAITIPIMIVLAVITLSIIGVMVIYCYCSKKNITMPKVEGGRIIVKANSGRYEESFHLKSLQQSNPSAEINCDEGNRFSAYVINCISSSDSVENCNDKQYCLPACCETQLKKDLRNLELKEVSIQDIGLKEQLGSGQFGVVYRGQLKYLDKADVLEVAVKTLKVGSQQEDRIKFLQEAAVMGQFSHPYVIKIYGVVTCTKQYMIVCELMTKGDLTRYLQTIRVSGAQDSNKLGTKLLKSTREIASAMVYLSTKGFIHRDLAARNVLVSMDGVCKISDFGLSRDLQNENHYVARSGLVPVRWTAPEALEYSKYSTASDVWSFGVVLYEIWSFAAKPYKELNNKQVIERILTGYRLPAPPGCPRAIYEMMVTCWHPNSEDRPCFKMLETSLQQSDSTLLAWSEKDTAMYSKNARTIGAAFQGSESLYSDLQKTYEALTN